jgi:hypothetical protein
MQALRNFKTYFFRGLAVLYAYRFGGLAVYPVLFRPQAECLQLNCGTSGVLVQSNPVYLHITQGKKLKSE